MKKLFILNCLLVFSAFKMAAQCDTAIVMKRDEFEKVDYFISSSGNVFKSEDNKQAVVASFLLLERKGTLVVTFRLIEGTSKYCIEEYAEAIFLTKSGETIKLVNESKFNCKSDFNLKFGRKIYGIRNMEKLISAEVTKARFYAKDRVFEVSMDPEEWKNFQDKLRCFLELM